MQRVVSELQTKDPAVVGPILAQSLQDSEPEYRCTVAWVFLAYDFLAALPHVRPLLLHDSDDGVRGYICQILGASRRREAAPLLIETLMHDPDGTDRLVAARGLGYIGDAAAVPALSAAMKGDSGVDYEGRPVKEAAAEAIRRIEQASPVTSAS